MKLELSKEFVIFDTEYTTWEGAMERNWSGPGEHREIVQIGAVMVDGETLEGTSIFVCYVLPKINPKLSDFFIRLTGITQETVDAKGTTYAQALDKFDLWSRGLPLYSWGTDLEVMYQNAVLMEIPFLIPLDRGRNVRKIFEAYGVDTEGYLSSTIPRAFGEELPPSAHDALNDARSIAQALRALKRSLA